jgi:hypothetical protein
MTSTSSATAGKFEFSGLPTDVAPLMRVIMSAAERAPGEVSTALDECPYLETVVPDANQNLPEAGTVGSDANPIAMSDLTTLQLYRTARDPAGNPLETPGVTATFTTAGGWQREILNKLAIDMSFKPFELRCNFLGLQASLETAGSCSDEVFNALLAMHTLFRVGLAQKGTSFRSDTDAKDTMISRLAQILADGSWTGGSMLADSSSSPVFYEEVLRAVESPYELTVTGMYPGVRTPIEQTMEYNCASGIAAAELGQLLTGTGAPTRATWRTGASSYTSLGATATAFAAARNELEGNAAQCCRARNCANAADAFQEACYLTDNSLSPATCALSSPCDLGPGTGENCSP